jgi:CRP-like cAMP-binding protein
MLEDRVYMPKDTVVMYDDFPDGMYFIDNGVLGVYSQTDELLAELSEGSFFGEIALLLDRKRSASVLALTWCNVKMLSKTNFDSVLKGKKSFVQHTCRCCCCIVVALLLHCCRIV